MNAACRDALKAFGTSEIKWKNIDDARKQSAAKHTLTALLNCPETRAMVLSWDVQDSRHQVRRRDDTADFHRMLFHGLRSVADWFGDREFHWYHDLKDDLDQIELQAFLQNTRGYKAMVGMPIDLFGECRHAIRFRKVDKRCSKEVPIIGIADLLAGAIRHSIQDAAGCLEHHRNRGCQTSMEFEEVATSPTPTRAAIAKREMVSYIRDECGRRSLGVSLESTARLATHRKGKKLWLWHYEPQGDYDKSPTKARKGND